MFSSSTAKLFYLFFVFSLSFAGCAWKNAEDVSNTNSQPFAAREIENEVPFQTKEPENFQTEIVATSVSGDEKIERKNFLARSGANRFAKFAVGERAETARLETADGKIFLLNFNEKIYAEVTNQNAAAIENDSLRDFLTTEWLNAKTGAAFENQGTENGLTKYLVRLNDSVAGEILIFYDDAQKILMRQEFYALNGGQRTLLYTVELKNLQLQTDDALFKLPENFVKVSVREFEQSTWRKKV